MGGYGRIEPPFLSSNPIIDIGRHAISTEERRRFYRDNLWCESAPTQDFRQVWFSGAHSDVGGSYKEHASGLSKIALEWMLVVTAKAELELLENKSEDSNRKMLGVPQSHRFARSEDSLCHWLSRTTYERVTDLSHLERLIDCRAQNRVFGGTAQIDAYISSVT